MEPGEVMVALASLGVVGLVFYPIARALGQRLEGRTTPVTTLAPAHDPRLERMEQAIDAIAVEIERITEAQRFTTRLLSERVQLPANQNGGGDSGVESTRRPAR